MNSDILKKAAEALEEAATDISVSRDREDTLVLENQKLKLIISAMLRAGKAKELSAEMARRGIIPQKDIIEKAKSIMNLDDTAYSILKSTVMGATMKDVDMSPFNFSENEGVQVDDDVLKKKTIDAILNA